MAVDKNIELNSKAVILDKLPVAVSYVVKDSLRSKFPSVSENMTVHQSISHMADHVSYTFLSYLSNIHKQDKVETTLFKYPATVWEFFKEKYAPTWFLTRWPVQYESKKIPTHVEKNFMCPHMVLSDNYPHVMWMMESTDPLYSKKIS